MKMMLMVAMGGAIGSSLRYLVGVLATRLFGINFPWGTMIVNITGSFMMGVLVTLLALRFSVSNEVRALLAIGVLGGFTTFSSFALDFVYLFEKKQYYTAMGYMSISVLCSVLALFLGLAVTRSLAG
ncbi:MAG: fluoride efflux transporter CrcB [Hyphomicrobiaceae bacterium]|nr:fluoride efflux transporter CrcB [Hyphomicrobiaceae bacterium]